MTDPSTFNNDCMSVLETYVVLLYDRTCTETTVNSARKHIFTTKVRSIDSIPPTGAALLQHTTRAIYQGGHVWGQALLRSPIVPSPETYVWQKISTQGWQPFWTLLPERWPHVLNCFDVNARKGVWDYANVSGQLLNVHHSVIAVATAITR